jgi:AcrR family transcriptional regulator
MSAGDPTDGPASGPDAAASGGDVAPSRKQLMTVAIDCFARLGFQGTSIERIAREAGVTKGAVYYHFRDKEDLLFAAVTDRIGGFEGQVLKAVEPGCEAMTALRRVVDACFFHATVSNHRRFIITLMVEALDVHPRLSEKFRRILRRMRAFLAEVIRRGQHAGTFRPDVDARAAAATLAGGIMGAEIQHYQDPEEVDLRAVLDTLVEQVAGWLASDRPSARGGDPSW